MWILDREWDRAFVRAYLLCFVKAYCVCLVALVGLYVVIDSISNLDKFFEESANSTTDLFLNMGRFYLTNMSLILGRICGFVTVMAAIFTVTWMRQNHRPSK
jgi:lipopolysaccharide export system permease protein